MSSLLHLRLLSLPSLYPLGATGVHNVCFQQVQDDTSKARSVNNDWEFVSKGTEMSLGNLYDLCRNTSRHSLINTSFSKLLPRKAVVCDGFSCSSSAFYWHRLVVLHSVLIKAHEEMDNSPRSVSYRPVGSTKQCFLKKISLTSTRASKSMPLLSFLVLYKGITPS